MSTPDQQYEGRLYTQIELEEKVIEARIDELGQLGTYRMLDSEVVHGRHSRSFRDRLAILRAEKQAKTAPADDKEYWNEFAERATQD